MELRESFKNLELKILGLITQPFFEYYLNTLENKTNLKENIHMVLEDIKSTLNESDLYLLNHYEVSVESYYTFLNFYEEQVEDSSLFATQEIMKIMMLNSNLESSYNIYFKVDLQSVPSDINITDNIVNTKCKDLIVDKVNVDNNEILFSLLNTFTELKNIKEEFYTNNLNFEVENLFFLLCYQLQTAKLNDNIEIGLNSILKTINAIQFIFLEKGYLNLDKDFVNIPSKLITPEGQIEFNSNELEVRDQLKKNDPNLKDDINKN